MWLPSAAQQHPMHHLPPPVPLAHPYAGLSTPYMAPLVAAAITSESGSEHRASSVNANPSEVNQSANTVNPNAQTADNVAQPHAQPNLRGHAHGHIHVHGPDGQQHVVNLVIVPVNEYN